MNGYRWSLNRHDLEPSMGAGYALVKQIGLWPILLRLVDDLHTYWIEYDRETMTPEKRLKEIEDTMKFMTYTKDEVQWLIYRVKKLTDAILETEGRFSCPKCRKTGFLLKKALGYQPEYKNDD